MNLSTKLANIELVHPILNAAGTCKTLQEFKKLIHTPLPAVMVGSITPEAREGNAGSTFYSNELFSINSIGLANLGLSYYLDNLPKMVEIAKNADKYVFVSIEANTPYQYALALQELLQTEVSLVEINMGCPNKWEYQQQVAIPSYNPKMLNAILQACEFVINPTITKPIAVKLSPIVDAELLKKVAYTINSYSWVKVVVASNTLPNAFAFDENDAPAIQSVSNLGGLSGPALKPIALGQVVQLKKLLRKDIDIVGVGGIKTGKDVLDYLNAGASAVQIATEYFRKGPNLFDKILTELVHMT